MILQQLTTLYTIFISKYIDTGDKLLDSSIIGIIVYLLTSIITKLLNEWYIYYNFIIFYLYGMYNDPLNIMKVPYKFKTFDYTSYDQFISQNTYVLTIGYKLITNDCGIIKSSYIKYLDKYNIIPIHNNCDKTSILSPTNNSNRIYQIAISKTGNIIYSEFKYDDIYIRSKHYVDLDFIEPFIINELNNIISSLDKISSDDIYIPIITPPDKNKFTLQSLGKISKKKTFDTLYYEQKDELINIIGKFKNGKLYPSHIPIDNKLGILLYGPPGTGKTGTILAIANMLNRSILIINFTNIKTCKQLDEILRPSYYDKYVIVFDEFDCILDVISGKNNEDNVSFRDKGTDFNQMLLYAEGEERKNILEMIKQGRCYKPDANIDMAYLLQKLDGLESAENRIIIATTNNPDNINPALLRPGRFDIKICLSYCTSQIAKDILLNFYKDDENIKLKIIEYLKIRNIKNNKFTPLQIVNMAIQTDYDSIETKLLNVLCY